MPVRIGTSGWQYRHWRDVLYPAGLPQREWLARYAESFAVVEVNNTFYNLPQRSTLWRTTDWGYLRLHEGAASPAPSYGDRALASWAERLSELWTPDEDVYVFFNNDPNGAAVRDAMRFAALVERQHREATRV